jgi:hypothetical protein
MSICAPCVCLCTLSFYALTLFIYFEFVHVFVHFVQVDVCLFILLYIQYFVLRALHVTCVWKYVIEDLKTYLHFVHTKGFFTFYLHFIL